MRVKGEFTIDDDSKEAKGQLLTVLIKNFDCFVNIVKNFNPDDAQNVPKRLQYKKDVIEGTVHRVFRSTSKWEDFEQALKKIGSNGLKIKIRKIGLTG